jgi:RNA polymerase sigma-70 factor (ECF subfamily)
MSETRAAEPPLDSSATPKPAGIFAATHWSLVLAAGGAAPGAQEALAGLCQSYWYPLYAYARSRGHRVENAQDLTQEFFARLLARNWLERADREKGRFRSFLLGAMNHFLADEWDKLRAQKRGGGAVALPLEFDTAESRYSREPVHHATPEQDFEHRWAIALLEQVVNRLRAEYETDGRSELFTLLHPCLIGDRTEQPYAEIATNLGTSEGTIKSAVHRLRRRYRELLREEIGHTVGGPGEVEDELRHLFAVLAR